MSTTAIHWSDAVDDTIRGDLVAAAAYLTPAGGAVVTSVATCGLDRRAEGILGFTTSLGFGRKLEHIIREPRVALAFHTRRHGFCDSPLFVLAQGKAPVDLKPSRERLEAFVPQAERYVGKTKRGLLWGRLLREYYWERVFVDIAVERVVTWPDLDAQGEPEVLGAVPFNLPAPQAGPSGRPCDRDVTARRGAQGGRASRQATAPSHGLPRCRRVPRRGAGARYRT